MLSPMPPPPPGAICAAPPAPASETFQVSHPAAVVLATGRDGQTREFPIGGARAVVGRVGGVEIRLDDVSVSRRHAELVRGPDGRWRVHDLGSHNGTSADGR